MSSSEGSSQGSWSTRVVDRSHERNAFRCGEPELDAYLQRSARQNGLSDLGRTYVLSPSATPNRVAGYYTLAAGAVLVTRLPPAMARSLPGYPVPVVLLARLAIDVEFQGQRLGEALLLDAFAKARDVAEIAGTHAVLVDALHDKAADFYKKYGFVQLVDAPRTLVLSMAVVRNSLGPK